ncbi:glycosyltransferase [Beduinella massiliensis]|uniref:glycosyltransferase n=1 Tax=Beduinella massiliensis TaxID=1852363 RepID=UPI000C81A40E
MSRRVMFVGASLGGGGSERVMSIIVNAFYTQGDSVKIIRLFDDKIDYKIESGIESKYIGNDLENPIIKKVKLVKELRCEIKEYKPDTIISFLTTCNVISILAARGLKINMIVSERNDPNNNVKTRFAAKVRNAAYAQADCLVCQTPDAVKYFPVYIQKKSAVIPNPISESLPDPYQGKKDNRIVMVCRLNKQKNLPMALNAFEEFHKTHKSWTLDIYGEGNEKEKLLQIASKLESRDNIKFHGFTKNVIEEIKTAGIYLSTSDYEGISNSMLEALAMGIPCVVTDCPIGGARMVIDNGKNGVLIPVNNERACKTALRTMADDSEARMSIGRKGIEIRKKYDKVSIMKEWNAVVSRGENK